jgi:hypothetical protein
MAKPAMVRQAHSAAQISQILPPRSDHWIINRQQATICPRLLPNLCQTLANHLISLAFNPVVGFSALTTNFTPQRVAKESHGKDTFNPHGPHHA